MFARTSANSPADTLPVSYFSCAQGEQNLYSMDNPNFAAGGAGFSCLFMGMRLSFSLAARPY
jgi:hypothetical protein